MKQFRLDKPARLISGTITLPASKSISNRLLIIRELSSVKPVLENLSRADDTQILFQALSSGEPVINIGHAGTAMRFLTAFLAVQKKEVRLDGSDRMRQRPIYPLVDALRTLGADIRYAATKGFPPLQFYPSEMRGGEIEVDASMSSQYISALMLIAPVLPGGLRLNIKGEPVSEPYLKMTALLMEMAGIKLEKEKESVFIAEQPYQPFSYRVEADWSSAAFWYEWLAFSEPGSSLVLENLRLSGFQGDQAAAAYFRFAGVETEATDAGKLIRKTEDVLPEKSFFNLVHHPDLAPALAATMTGLKVKGKLDGLQTLTIKESNRIEALKAELEKMGAVIKTGDDHLEFMGFVPTDITGIEADTYNDHRMAMALAPLVSLTGTIIVQNPDVISKSYPGFWENACRYCRITEI